MFGREVVLTGGKRSVDNTVPGPVRPWRGNLERERLPEGVYHDEDVFSPCRGLKFERDAVRVLAEIGPAATDPVPGDGRVVVRNGPDEHVALVEDGI